ncbi:MAG: PIN domain-containing protein [Candidatus Polarisedimenticolaceae bacterium]|nr:PIN domain-containing protein [Candidatus Polarisedimenticolaceae bacterium]
MIIQSKNYQVQQITPKIAELSVNLGAEINNDPADRLIAATSILKNAPIITADQNLRDATILETIW